MEFTSVEQTAKRLHVTTRAVQKWAKEGKIPGAKQLGRAWLIPTNITGPVAPNKTELSNTPIRIPFPLLSGSFAPGQCLAYIHTIADEDTRNIAMAEYFYYSGNLEKASLAVERYLNHDDLAISLIASLLYVLANMYLGRVYLSRFGAEHLKKYVPEALQIEDRPDLQAVAALIIEATKDFLHIPVDAVPSLESLVCYLPDGLKLYAFHFLAQKACERHEYHRVLGIGEAVLLFPNKQYPIATIYLKLVICAAYMNLQQVEMARTCFMEVWEFAQLDDLILPFSRLHKVMYGLLESCLKRNYPNDFKKLNGLTENFFKGFEGMYRAEAKGNEFISLTPTEFGIAMLVNHGWLVKEVAKFMDMSERMVKHHLSVIYEKLGVTSREELRNYMQL